MRIMQKLSMNVLALILTTVSIVGITQAAPKTAGKSAKPAPVKPAKKTKPAAKPKVSKPKPTTPKKPAVVDTTKRKDLKKVMLKRMFSPQDVYIDIFVKKVLSGGTIGGFSASVKVFTPEGKPAANHIFAVEGMRNNTAKTFKDGRVGFTVYPKNFKTLAIKLPKGYSLRSTKRTRMPITVHSIPYREGKKSKRLAKSKLKMKVITPFTKGLRFKRKGDIRVYYLDGKNRKLAEEMVKEIEQIKKFCKEFAGLELKTTMDIFLHHYEGPVKLSGIFAVPVQVDKNNKVAAHMAMWIQIHEAVESEIIFKNRAYGSDHNLRFAGDGLAELLSHHYCLKYYPQACKIRHSMAVGTLNSLIKHKIKSINLRKDFPAFTSRNKPKRRKKGQRLPGDCGYSASFYFWEMLRQNHGDNVVKHMIKWFANTKRPTKEKLLKEIKKITGVDFPMVIKIKDIKAELIKVIKGLNVPDQPAVFHATQISIG